MSTFDPSNEMQHRIVSDVQAAWNRGEQPDLPQMLKTVEKSEHQVWVAALTTDAECRAELNLHPTLKHYLDLFPWLAPTSQIVQELLAIEVSNAAPSYTPSRKNLLDRYGERFAGDIDLVLELLAGLSHSSTAQDQPSEGMKLGKYELRRFLGQGSFGQVWLAWDHELACFVALKLISPGADASRRMDSLLVEARAASGLHHPNVVGVRAAGRFSSPNDWMFIDMQLCGDPAPTINEPKAIDVGKSLPDWVLTKTLSVREIARLMSDVCRGVVAAHAQGVVHCDLKPANVLVTPSGKAMVADFGLSSSTVLPVLNADSVVFLDAYQSVAFRTVSGQSIRGTPAYMSPEQARGEASKPITDVYSLGAILYWLLAAREPYPANQRGLLDLLQEIGNPQEPTPRLPESANVTLGNICRRAMAKRQSDRYQSASAMLADLDAFLGHKIPPVVGPESMLQPLTLWMRRNALPVGIGVASVLGLAATTTVAVRNAREAIMQRDIAKQAEQRATKAFEFLESDVLAPDELADSPAGGAIASVLHFAQPNISRRFPDDPEIRQRLNAALGRAYLQIGMLEPASELLHQATRDGPRAFDERQWFELNQQIAEVSYRRSRADEDLDVAFIRQKVADAKARFGIDDLLTIDYMNQLGGVLKSEGQLDEAEATYKEVFERRTRLLGSDDLDTLITQHNLQLVAIKRARLESKERIPTALALLIPERDALTVATRRALGPEHPQTLATEAEGLSLRAERARLAGDIVDATVYEPLLREYPLLIDRMTSVMGDEHWRTMETEAKYMALLQRLGRHDDAYPRLAELQSRYERDRGMVDPDTLTITIWYATSAEQVGQFQHGYDALRRVYESNLHERSSNDLTTDQGFALLVCKLRVMSKSHGLPDLTSEMIVNCP
ncbi:MAG: serine/threonine-protein kinase [Phycisphaerales bacterium]